MIFSHPAILSTRVGFKYNNVITNSCMFDSASSTRARRNGVGDAVTQATISAWLKRTTAGNVVAQYYYSSEGATAANNNFIIGFTTGDIFRMRHDQASTLYGDYRSTAVFRDCSGWYHFYVAINSNEAVNTDRCKLYVNGYRVTLTVVDSIPLDNAMNTCRQNTAWGYRIENDDLYFDGYMAEACYIHGEVEPLSTFGEFVNGIWIPKSLTTLAAGFDDGAGASHYLDFEDNTDLGKDVGAFSSDFSQANMGTDHQVIDTPENNHCTLDYNNRNITGPVGIREGGLNPRYSGGAHASCAGTFLMKTGKWYWELDVGSDSQYHTTGILAAGEDSGDIITAGAYVGQSATGYGLMVNWGASLQRLYHNASYTSPDMGAVAANDIIQVAFDADNNKLWFGHNNTWTDSGDPAAGTNAQFDNGDGIDADAYDYVPGQTVYATLTPKLNFGQRTFTHTPPTGFKSLCTANLPVPAVIEPLAKAVNVKLYTGDGSVDQDITGVGFQPDFVWIKNRDTTDNHLVFDSVRGVTKWIPPNTTTAETADADTLLTFDEDGFSVGADVKVNTNTEDYAAYCLKEGAAYGFDIVEYTGTGAAHAINHNLGVVPKMIMVRRLGSAGQWMVYHYAAQNKTDPETDYGNLDDAGAWADLATPWNDTAPTSTQFTVGTHNAVNVNESTYVAYLWADIPGLVKCFHYEGNGNAAGPYIYCGFRPRWIIYKNADGGNDWRLYDSVRNTYNGVNLIRFLPDSNAAESTADGISMDMYANGFKIKVSTAFINTNNNSFVGIAFAEQPFKYANAR